MKNMLFVLALMAGCGLVGNVSAQADDAGEKLYKKKMCFACHGAGKMGGDLTASKMDKAAMTNFLKDPKAVKPKTTMPAFKGSDAELTALVDYVMGLRK